MRKLDTLPFSLTLAKLVNEMVARRPDADDILTRVKAGSCSLRVIVDDRESIMTLALIDRSGDSRSVLDAVYCGNHPDAGIAVSDWLTDESAFRNTH
jgi:hypothetical protein